jgi:hypothetical protein
MRLFGSRRRRTLRGTDEANERRQLIAGRTRLCDESVGNSRKPAARHPRAVVSTVQRCRVALRVEPSPSWLQTPGRKIFPLHLVVKNVFRLIEPSSYWSPSFMGCWWCIHLHRIGLHGRLDISAWLLWFLVSKRTQVVTTARWFDRITCYRVYTAYTVITNLKKKKKVDPKQWRIQGGQGACPPNVTNVIFFPMSLLIMLLGMSKFFLLASLATIPPT